MLKQLVIIFSIVSILGAFTIAQEKPESEKKHGCCSSMTKSDLKTETTDTKNENVVWNKVCPVKGEEVDAEAPTFEYNGKLIGFCCEGCDSKFKKNPETYLNNLNEDGTKFISKS